MSEAPWEVLHERWIPLRWDPKYIGEKLCALTKAAGFVPHVDPAHGPIPLVYSWFSVPLHAEVRQVTAPVPSASCWHQDGDTTPGSKMNCMIVTWANRTPTEFQWKGKIWQPEPFAVVVFRNQGPSHRRPENAPKWRWMFRQRVAVK